MEEVWEPVIGYENEYLISNLGRLKSLPRKGTCKQEKIIKLHKNHKGYLVCNLTKNSKHSFKQIHRLVAETFIPNYYNLPQVNHKDGNKENNCINNLEWINNYDNMQHSIKTGLRDVNKIINNLKKVNMKKVNQYDLEGNFIKTWNSMTDIQNELHIFNQNISKVCQGKRKQAGGFIWKYSK